MDINDRLYVEINPLTSGQIPQPHPIDSARFDPAYVYKVLGMYNPSETSECYMVLANIQRQIWFISQRHLLAFGLIDSDELFLTLDQASTLRRGNRRTGNSNGHHFSRADRFADTDVHQSKDHISQKQST